MKLRRQALLLVATTVAASTGLAALAVIVLEPYGDPAVWLGCLAIFLVVSVCAGWGLERLFVRRVAQLALQLEPVESAGATANIEPVSGDDEIADLSRRAGQLVRQLGELRQKAAGADRAKAEFLATMSHEIRTPLNGVLGSAALLRDTSLDRAQRELVAAVESSGEGLLTVLNGVLDFTLIEAGAITLATQPVDLRGLVADVGRAVAPQIDAKGLTYQEHVASDVPHAVTGDPARLRQVLLHLVGNAVKFTPAGLVRVQLSVVERRDDGECVLRFMVTDTGIGLSDTERARLFAPFSQGDASTTRQHGGSGLGLAISSRLVKAMQGEITVESVFRQGATFTFTVPAREVDPPPAVVKKSLGVFAESVTAEWARHLPLAVLVAEDNAVNRRMIGGLLKKFGYAADYAEDGREALNAVQARRYDLVLMDVQMPVMDGYAATRAIREWERGAPATPLRIIAVTANALAGDREKCLDAGMDDYLTKPLRVEELRTALMRAFRDRA